MTRLSEAPLVHPTASVSDSRLGRYTEVGARTTIARSTLGDYSYVVEDAQIAYGEIGKFANIAAGVRIYASRHPVERASLHHFTYRSSWYFEGEADDAGFFEGRARAAIAIGHDTWIGHGAIVMPGVRIGTGAAVGGGAVVTRDVAPFTIVAGVPARPIRRRFSEAVAERLEALAWWDWPHERLREALPDFRRLSVEAFLERHEGERHQGAA